MSFVELTARRISSAAWGRIALTVAVFGYVAFRFGGDSKRYAFGAAILILLLELLRVLNRRPSGNEAAIDPIAAAIQPMIVLCVAFAPAPFGLGSDVPRRVVMDGQVIFLAMCFLASNAAAARPASLWSSGGGILFSWLAAERWMTTEPHVLTVADLHIANYKTPLAFLTAQNDPHYFNYNLWQGSFIAGAMITAALGLGLHRTRLLARRVADAESSRRSLATFFSPPVTEAILASRDGAMAPQEKEIAVVDCDLVGFTALAESLPPEDVAAMLQAWRSVVEDTVFAHDGAILAHTGDGSIALFGLLDSEGDAASRSVAAARAIVRAWALAATSLPSAPQPAVGVDFGTVRAGLMGKRILSFLADGPAMESAARLQRETRDVFSPILVGNAAIEEMEQSGLDVHDAFERCGDAWKPIAEFGP